MTEQQARLRDAVREYLVWCFKHESAPRADELARFVGMSRSAFSRHFKAICGGPPGRALKRAQLHYAHELIGAGARTNRAAYQAGYGSRRTLYRSFRRAFGSSPSAASIPEGAGKSRGIC